MKTDKNWPQLSAARIDDMIETAIAFPQERPQMLVWFSRPAMAIAASVVLLIAVAAAWQVPNYNPSPQVQNASVSDDIGLTDYMMYDLLEDLT
ncbi:MAG TPA: hypothetical protein PKW15_01725 [Alphaproteobacteria bacterium]|nr:hypothetical protein [Rhodospirillaceae bacterium]HRJ11943.1 hypothetical protein [Alphaproteobacteria bacterium]